MQGGLSFNPAYQTVIHTEEVGFTLFIGHEGPYGE